MATQDNVRVSGRVVEVGKAGIFTVSIKLGDNNENIVCHLSGKMRKNDIRIVAGDLVEVDMSPYDLTKGRIVYRTR